ncbi:MAG: sulfotransferase family 2 domain-containing protein [Gammaproteobacteria bacterium]|nr:sulfotransferase family 2 domain-containing protein [Gammaproteobacteria bacterium]
MRPRSLIFLHIPKTGGTTLRNIIAEQYEDDSVFSIGPLINEAIQGFRHQPQTRRQRIRLLQGHMAFGLHIHLERPISYFTLLRDPMERALSDYCYVKTSSHHPLHRLVAGMTVGDYLQSGLTGQLSNGQTRLLCGDCMPGEPGIPGVRPMEEQDLELAISNLNEHFIVVGLVERFDETLTLLKRKLHWKRPLYVKANVGPKDVGHNMLSESDERLIAKLNDLDIRLYQTAERLFRQQVNAEGLGFKLELLSFKMMNGLYQVYHQLRYRLHPRIRFGLANLVRRLRIST